VGYFRKRRVFGLSHMIAVYVGTQMSPNEEWVGSKQRPRDRQEMHDVLCFVRFLLLQYSYGSLKIPLLLGDLFPASL
jgi:hypothetical protein